MSPDTGNNTAWWEGIYFDQSRMITQDMLSDAVWYQMLNIAKRRFNFAVKFSKKNSSPYAYDRLVHGELLGIQNLAKDLSNAGVIANSPEGVNKLSLVIRNHEARCKKDYGVFP